MNNECTTCTGGHKSFGKPKHAYSKPCEPCDIYLDATCVTYSGEVLSFMGNESNINIEEMFTLLDRRLEDTHLSNWNYNYSCLDPNGHITTQRQFVERISTEVCSIKSFVNNISNVPNLVQDIDDRVTSIENPGLLSNSFVGIKPSDNYTQVIGRLATASNTLYEYVDLNGVNWDRVYTVSQTPVNVSGGFNEVFRQIELLYNRTDLSVDIQFDTTYSCLPTKTENTPLATVVRELYESYCTTSAVHYDGNSIVWGCVNDPSENTLQSSIQNIVSHLGDLYKFKPVFDSAHFDVEEIANCQGYSIKLKEGSYSGDGKVLVNASAANKYYLSEAIEEGDNIEIDVVGDKLRVSASLPSVTNVSVTGLGVNGPLDDVLITPGNSGAIYTTKSINSEGKLVIGVSVDYAIFADNLLNEIRNNPVLLDKLCNINCSCQSCS